MDKNNDNMKLERQDGTIIEREIVDEMKTAYIDYAMSVIVARALPDARDGLKPVHRRILYTMNEDGLTPDKPYRKSATTVGDVLGRYHPHGDSSVYDAMVRLAQDFTQRYKLIDGHGNFGSIDNDPPAAYRYTEARLDKMALLMLQDIDKDTVDFMPNFDDRLQEPTVLPTKLPALLLNGSSGIAVGMATNIPPHNIKEVIDGIIQVVDHPETTIDELMKIIKGPDFPTGAMIMGRDGIKEAYTTGRGKVIMRGEAEIEEMPGNRQKIIITSIPYGVNKAKLIVDMSDLAKLKKVEGMSEIRDESDRNEMVRIVIELKRDARPQVILNQLYKHTALQSTFGIIILALVNGEPKILTLRDCLDVFINHRKDVIVRRTQFELEKALARAHILEGLKIAIDNIDEIIQIIRTSYDDAKENLMKRFNLSDIQAQAILDMQLKRLQGLQREKLEEEYNELMRLIDYYRKVLSDEQEVLNIIKTEMLEIREKYGDDRRTKIAGAVGEFEDEDLIKEEQVVIALTHFDYIKRMPIDTYKSQRRGGKGITGITAREGDFVKQIFTANTHDTILFFTSKGKMYRLRGFEVPEAGRTAKGTAIVNLLNLEPGERVSAVIPIKEYSEDKFILMGTKKGVIKKTPLKEYDSARTTGIIGINLRDDDELIDVRLTDGEDSIVMVTRHGIAIRFDEKDVRPLGRVSQGVIGIRLDEDDYVIGMEPVWANSTATLLTITENGFGKRTEIEEYRVQNRGGRGVLNYKVTPKTGEIVGIRVVGGNEDVMLITDTGTIIRLNVSEISVLGRATQGVTLMRTNEGKVVSIEAIYDEGELEEIKNGVDQGEQQTITE